VHHLECRAFASGSRRCKPSNVCRRCGALLESDEQLGSHLSESGHYGEVECVPMALNAGRIGLHPRLIVTWFRTSKQISDPALASQS